MHLRQGVLRICCWRQLEPFTAILMFGTHALAYEYLMTRIADEGSDACCVYSLKSHSQHRDTCVHNEVVHNEIVQSKQEQDLRVAPAQFFWSDFNPSAGQSRHTGHSIYQLH